MVLRGVLEEEACLKADVCYVAWIKQTNHWQHVDPSWIPAGVDTWRQQLCAGSCNQRQTVASDCRCGDRTAQVTMAICILRG